MFNDKSGFVRILFYFICLFYLRLFVSTKGTAAEKVRRPRDTVVPAEGHGRWKQDTTTAYSASAYTAAASPSSHQVRQEFIRGLMTISYLNVGNEKLQGRKQTHTPRYLTG